MELLTFGVVGNSAFWTSGLIRCCRPGTLSPGSSPGQALALPLVPEPVEGEGRGFAFCGEGISRMRGVIGSISSLFPFLFPFSVPSPSGGGLGRGFPGHNRKFSTRSILSLPGMSALRPVIGVGYLDSCPVRAVFILAFVQNEPRHFAPVEPASFRGQHAEQPLQ